MLFRKNAVLSLLATSVMAVTAKSDSLLSSERTIEAHQLDGFEVNANGVLAAVGIKKYSFEKSETAKELYIIDTSDKTASKKLVSSKTSEGAWINDEEVLYLDDKTLRVKNIHDVASADEHGLSIGEFPVKPDSMRLAQHDKDSATLIFSAEVYADGDLTKVPEHDESEAVKEWEDVKAYDAIMVRHWDRWLMPGRRSQLFSVDLKRQKGKKWSITSSFRNLLNGTAIECPVKPFGDAGDYAVSSTHVAFTARDPSVNAAWHTKHNIYLVDQTGGEIKTLTPDDQHGASSSPAFSPHGDHLVWLQMNIDGYEADRNRITLYHIPTGTKKVILPDWTHSPSLIQFSRDGKSLVGVVEHDGRKKLFTIALHRDDEHHKVVYHTQEGAISKIQFAKAADEYIVSATTMQHPGELFHVGKDVERLTNFTYEKNSPLRNVVLGPKPEHITYKGANGRDAYAWVMKPPHYDEKKTYPLLVIIHGGPESAFLDDWSRRWNLLTLVAQGDFVGVAFNPAGSTSYGQTFTEEIIDNLGGTPFEDIILGTHHILDTMANVDRERVVAAGASYGGYMINWIEGHNEDKLFKGLVNHDGIFSVLGMVGSADEIYFPEYESQGSIFDPEVRKRYYKWSPELYAHRWETPMLVIHGGRDYRLPDSEGLSTFNVLQRRGIASRFVYFPKESHWVLGEKNSQRWYKEVVDWLVKYSQPSQEEESQEPSLVFQSA